MFTFFLKALPCGLIYFFYIICIVTTAGCHGVPKLTVTSRLSSPANCRTYASSFFKDNNAWECHFVSSKSQLACLIGNDNELFLSYNSIDEFMEESEIGISRATQTFDKDGNEIALQEYDDQHRITRTSKPDEVITFTSWDVNERPTSATMEKILPGGRCSMIAIQRTYNVPENSYSDSFNYSSAQGEGVFANCDTLPPEIRKYSFDVNGVLTKIEFDGIPSTYALYATKEICN